jgi:lipopolysaccharide/colanic/teichoic acid biosynthesis glycosyltransferase
MDYVISFTAIVLASPLLILIAALVKLTSPGPVIYRQERVGKNGRNFLMLKFRTMSQDAEKGTGAVWAKQNDPRVTPIGGILRKAHLDELPQLFNVLKGEMSIVGPRPERPEIVMTLKETIQDYEKRLQVLPGITGLAQVFHRYDETIADVRKKVKYDLLYIKKMCWLAEMRILALTCVVMLTGKEVR